MAVQGTVEVSNLDSWMDLAGVPEIPDASERCNVAYLQGFLDKHVALSGITVVSAEINRSGGFRSAGIPNSMITETDFGGLPDFCDVLIRHSTGRHEESVNVWVPLRWNGRLLGVGGGGTRTQAWLPEMFTTFSRAVSMPKAVRNGFACVTTDGGILDPELYAWGIDHQTGAYDWELHYNLVDYCTHSMTVLAKAVIAAITGEGPEKSYYLGTSGGGRQGLAEAQKYPEDFDGIWADCPALAFNRMLPSILWPAVVMNELDDALPPEKFEAFRQQVYDAVGGRDAFYRKAERTEVDPYDLVGVETSGGETITEKDAEVMRRIWEGPRTPEGEWLWYGMRPGTEGWTPFGYANTRQQEDGSWVPVPFLISVDYMTKWVMRDESWDWHQMTMDSFCEYLRRSQAAFPDLSTENPDLRNLRDSGGKLILCHGTDDPAIYVDDTIGYYERVVEVLGGIEETKGFARLFVVPGDGHGEFSRNGAGPSIATAMAALMRWVEDGAAPDAVHGQQCNPMTGEVLKERDIPAWQIAG